MEEAQDNYDIAYWVYIVNQMTNLNMGPITKLYVEALLHAES